MYAKTCALDEVSATTPGSIALEMEKCFDGILVMTSRVVSAVHSGW